VTVNDTLEEKVERLLRAKAEAVIPFGTTITLNTAVRESIINQFREPLLVAFKALSKVPHKIIMKLRCIEVDPAGNTYEETEEHASDCAGCEAVRVLALLDQDGEGKR
jgi:hypothetical protein